ncbi:MAG: RidA family protein [Pseudomonadota bacterium]
MTNIQRFAGDATGRSRASAFKDLVFTVGTSSDRGGSVHEQTVLTLEAIQRNLADAGSDKSRLLSATVYLTDIQRKSEMDQVWCDWIGESDNWPQRACVQADLAPGTLVEITVIAARLDG